MTMGTREELVERICADPNVCFGRPVIRGTRIWVSLILDLMASGMPEEEILGEYPQLVSEDVRAALAYGAAVTQGRYFELAFREEQ